mmetsp:Transcript_10700/g.26193  ORF Transcript_10700/g.26193 Transcript_10700/m.26193 type:complete len:117 (+) Transcript_10700:274-624(+)
MDCAEMEFCGGSGSEEEKSASEDDEDEDEDEEPTPDEDPPVKDSERSSDGWELWPKVKRGRYGLVFVVSQRKFGYYDDEEEPECIVYYGTPLSDECDVFRRSDLRQPPFQGEYRSM